MGVDKWVNRVEKEELEFESIGLRCSEEGASPDILDRKRTIANDLSQG